MTHSTIDHASSEALHELHLVITHLERKRAEGEKLAQERIRKLTDELK